MHLNETLKTQNTREFPLWEQDEIHGIDSLRQALLRDKGFQRQRARIDSWDGQRTVAVKANAKELTPESFFTISDRVEELCSNPSHNSQNIDFVKTGTTILGQDKAVKEENRQDAANTNVTFLYPDVSEYDYEAYTPSAALVHEEMTQEQVAELRDKLPSGVPIINAKDGQLLDGVGAEERQQGDKYRRISSEMSGIAFQATLHLQGRDPYNLQDYRRQRTSRSYSRKSSDKQYDTFDASNRDSWAKTFEEIPSYSVPVRDTYDFGISSGATGYRPWSPKKARPATKSGGVHLPPEPQEAAANRRVADIDQARAEAARENDKRNIIKAKEKILEHAKGMYGAEHIGNLSDDEVERIRRQTLHDFHPDKGHEGGGDYGAFQEAQVMLEKAKQVREAIAQSERPTEQASSKAEDI